MFAAMQDKKSVHLNSHNSLGRNSPFHVVGPKNNFRVSRAFENLFVHFLVASIAAAVPACRVHDDFPAGLSRRRIKLQTSCFECERSVDRVNRAPKRPMHSALSWVDSENNFTGRRLRRSMLRQRAEHHHRQGSCYQQIEDRRQTASGPIHLSFAPFTRSEIANRSANS